MGTPRKSKTGHVKIPLCVTSFNNPDAFKLPEDVQRIRGEKIAELASKIAEFHAMGCHAHIAYDDGKITVTPVPYAELEGWTK